MIDVETRATQLLGQARTSRDPAVHRAAYAVTIAAGYHRPAADPRHCAGCSVPPADVPFPCPYLRHLVDQLDRALAATHN